MSFRAVTWAFDQIRGMGATTKLVLLALAEFANDQDDTWRSRDEIAARAECSTKTVDRSLKQLEDGQLITRNPLYRWCDSDTPTCATKGAHKHRYGTIYHLHLDRTMQPQRESELPSQTNAVSTVPKMSTVKQTAGSSQKSHSRQNVPCETPPRPQWTNGASHSGHRCPPFESVNPQLNPHTNQPIINSEIETSDSESESVGLVGNPQTQTEPDTGSSAPAPRAEPGKPADAYWSLIGRCLPDAWCHLDRSGAIEIAHMLQDRITAGWTHAQIRKIMRSQTPPEKYSRLAGVLKHRLEQHVVPELAPQTLQAARKTPTVSTPTEPAKTPAEKAWENTVWNPTWEWALRQGLGKLDALRATNTRIDQAGLNKQAFVSCWNEMRAQCVPNATDTAITELTLNALKPANESAPMST